MLLALPAAQVVVAAPAPATKSLRRTDDTLEGVKTAIRLKDFGAAQSELQRLADAGNADAQYLLAAFYLNGLGGPRNPVQAKLWLEKSATGQLMSKLTSRGYSYDLISDEQLAQADFIIPLETFTIDPLRFFIIGRQTARHV